MTQVRIRIDDDASDELLSAFPQLSPTPHRAQTTLTGAVADQAELQAVLNFLNSMGITIIDVVTIPDPG